ncbi:MAG TPA: hypothetical protein VK705_05645 [Ferruginibacter sp.]|jgi:hypothetical protein|nr:hypothetical protein [Ferruginibacter sp.]
MSHAVYFITTIFSGHWDKKQNPMKKLIIASLLCFYSFICLSQGIGSTENEIRASHIERLLKSGNMDNGLYYLCYDYSLSDSRIWYFFENGICKYKTMEVFNQESLTELVKMYNENEVAVSQTEWIQYTSDGIERTKLSNVNGVWSFTSTLEKK